MEEILVSKMKYTSVSTDKDRRFTYCSGMDGKSSSLFGNLPCGLWNLIFLRDCETLTTSLNQILVFTL